jgi:serine/threonine protein kinase
MSGVGDAALEHLRALITEGTTDLGRYELQELVGEGGMGQVYRARDTTLGRDVAIKLQRSSGQRGWAERFRREARVIAALEHPGIVPVHDAGILPDGRAYYVMTLVRGQRLDIHLHAVPGLADRLRLFQRILEPIGFAHSRGVVHRDLKPSNIMVGPFGEVLVMDWGLALQKSEGEGEEAGRVAGTAGFMAPEQARGAPESGEPAVDVFALGAILAWLVPEAGAPRPLRAIAARAMASRPADRYRGVSELGAEVARFLEGEPVAAYRESIWERLARLAGRYRTALVLVLAYLTMRLLLLLLDRP